MFRKVLVGSLLSLFSVWAFPASASTITFDPTGGGGGFQIDLFDWAPGNEISLNGGGATPNIPGKLVESLFQANLNVADLSTTAVKEYTNGNSGHFFTLVAGIPEVISGASTPTTVAFDLAGGTPAAPNANNYFYIYTDTNGNNIVNGGVPNDRSGVCFTCGTLILSGVFVNDATFNNTFTVDINTPPPGPPLDGFNGNDYPGVTTLTGTGGLTANVFVTSANAGFFPGLLGGSVITFKNSSQNNLPYGQVDPSACFSRNGLTAITACTVAGAVAGAGGAGVGAVNGEFTDIMLQSDASTSFVNAAVPEPATLTLFGTGLLAAVLRRRHQNKARS